jgi:hypothetical protein
MAKVSSENGEVTVIASATSKSQSLRTTIPAGIVRQFRLREKQRLNWSIKISDNKMVIMVTPEAE